MFFFVLSLFHSHLIKMQTKGEDGNLIDELIGVGGRERERNGDGGGGGGCWWWGRGGSETHAL